MQKTVQNDKKFCLLHSISEEPYITWLLFMFLKLFMLCFFSYFFHFCEHFDFLAPYGVKGQKTVQNDKKLCLSHSISQEPFIIWLSFMVQMCKMIISLDVFFSVTTSIFQVVKGLKGQKMAQNIENFCLSHLIFQELYIIWSSFMVQMYV